MDRKASITLPALAAGMTFCAVPLAESLPLVMRESTPPR